MIQFLDKQQEAKENATLPKSMELWDRQGKQATRYGGKFMIQSRNTLKAH
jgi:hypothetical protein